MAQVFAKFYLDKGGIVREMIYKDEDVKFYINHEKVDVDTYTKIMGNEFPEIVPLLNDLKRQIEGDTKPEEPEYTQVSFREGVIHGYHYGDVLVVNEEEGEQVDFDFEDSELGLMLSYVRPNCHWFIPTSEYKKHKGVDY